MDTPFRSVAGGLLRRPIRWTACAAAFLLLSGGGLRAQSANPDQPTEPEPTEHPFPLRPVPSPAEALTGSPTGSFLFPEGDPEELPDHLLVVYNSRDPDSKALADYYAERRHIPAERILGIACSTQEEITRAEYEQTVREPIISYIYKKNWMTRTGVSAQVGARTLQLWIATRNDVWAMVLMRGVPLKIAQDPGEQDSMEPNQAALQYNAAAVDSELALLPVFGLPRGGFAPNSFYDAAATGLVRTGPELATRLIMVTRLDGPQPADVRRMIDDTLYAEQNRLDGLAVVDSRGATDPKDRYIMGDQWMRRAREALLHDGWSVKFDDNPDCLPPTDPCNHVALYLGWYRDGAYGPWITPPDRFVRGAIAYHLHSFSAATVRSATSGWVGPLIAHGAAATMGTVYEPYLFLTPHIDIFAKRLLAGDYFAEAAYACQPGLSWMVTVIGDPLYQPFQTPLVTALAAAGPASSDPYDWLLLQRVQRELDAGQIDPTVEALERNLNIPGTVAQEGLGDLLEKLDDPRAVPAAETAYKEAGQLDALPIDRIRVGLKLAQLYADHSEKNQAQAEWKTLWDSYPDDAKRFAVPAPPGGRDAVPEMPGSRVSVSPSPVDTSVLPKPPGPPKPPAP